MDEDFARISHGVGINGLDTSFGHTLAEMTSLTPRQASAGKRMIAKYRRQLPADILDALGLTLHG